MTLALFGNFLGMDTLIILLVIALLFGGKKLPELAKSLGASIREFKKGKDAPAEPSEKLP